MHIRKQRLLTPGPTPLYPPALHAMMASDLHHRTEDFRKAYRSCLADLKEVLGTSNDVLMFVKSGVSIAMGNASAEVQKSATYVTTSSEDEGFANAMERFILKSHAAAG